jgi:anthranilate/para-aminobenzoate synthase component II
MIAVIDNYDSFTYNLVQFLGELGAELEVFRNDQVTVEQIAARDPSHLVISPGPGTPDDARPDPDPRRVPRAPMHRRGVRREGGTGGGDHAR